MISGICRGSARRPGKARLVQRTAWTPREGTAKPPAAFLRLALGPLPPHATRCLPLPSSQLPPPQQQGARPRHPPPCPAAPPPRKTPRRLVGVASCSPPSPPQGSTARGTPSAPSPSPRSAGGAPTHEPRSTASPPERALRGGASQNRRGAARRAAAGESETPAAGGGAEASWSHHRGGSSGTRSGPGSAPAGRGAPAPRGDHRRPAQLRALFRAQASGRRRGPHQQDALPELAAERQRPVAPGIRRRLRRHRLREGAIGAARAQPGVRPRRPSAWGRTRRPLSPPGRTARGPHPRPRCVVVVERRPQRDGSRAGAGVARASLAAAPPPQPDAELHEGLPAEPQLVCRQPAAVLFRGSARNLRRRRRRRARVWEQTGAQFAPRLSLLE